MSAELADIDLYNPDGYVQAPPHEIFDHLRETSPVYWQDMPDQPGYWAVLRHADVVEVAKNPQVFSASEGGVVLENLAPANLEQMRNMLLAMDPPRHTTYRRAVSPEFTARVIGQMEERIRTICQEIMTSARTLGTVDFVHDVAAKLPSQVIGELMGLPRDDWARIHNWAEMQTSSQDPDVAPDPNATEGVSPSMEMAIYAMGFAAERRTLETQPDDLTSVILGSDFGSGPMSDADFGSFFVQLVTAGNDTTKTMLAGGLHALLTHPEQLAALRADPSLAPGAVEEILRWANPLHYFRRTATEDYELTGTKIAAGDKVSMMYTSANRDPAVFDDPHQFNIHRSPNPHLSFGIAQHFCLGVHLARLEGKVFFQTLLSEFDKIELLEEPVRLRSNLNNALKRLQVSVA